MSRIALSVILTFGFSIAQRGDITQPRMISESNFCSAYLTCSECLQQDQCAWCSKQVCPLKKIYLHIYLSSNFLFGIVYRILF